MPEISIEPNAAQLDRVARELQGYEKEIPAVLTGGINDAARVTKTEISRLTRERVNIKKAELDPYIFIEKATQSGSPRAVIRMAARKRIGLEKFNARQVKGKNVKRIKGLNATRHGAVAQAGEGGLVYQIYKGQDKSFLPGAFLVAKASLPHGDPTAEGAIAFIREGSKRLPIERLRGPSPLAVFTRSGLAPEVMKISEAEVEKQIDRRLNFMLLKIGGQV